MHKIKRNLIKTGLSLILGGCGISSPPQDIEIPQEITSQPNYSQEVKEQLTNKDFSFLYQLPDIENIKIYDPSADDHIAVIKQMHPPILLPILATQNLMNLVRKQQKSISNIASQLVNQGYVKGVYYEGITIDSPTKNIENILNKCTYFEENFPSDLGPILAIQELYPNNISIFPAETEKANKQAEASLILFLGLFSNQKVLEDRENTALKIINHDPSLFQVLIFGGDHNYQNNITDFNLKNNTNYGLIEIFPKGYSKAREESKKWEQGIIHDLINK